VKIFGIERRTVLRLPAFSLHSVANRRRLRDAQRLWQDHVAQTALTGT
jgi:hypothetical protein